MQKQDKRERAETLISDLARATSPEVLAVRELLSLQYEITKDKLVSADAAELVKLQGEARCLDRLFKSLTRPVTTNQE